jgi:tRNA threonylcarbamoyladenosine biosynthesis protein TsaB
MESRVILGIDNSLDFLNIAVSEGDSLIEERNIRNKRAPSEIIADEVLHILSSNGYLIDDVGTILVTLGPGSFTGIRVALSFCKGLSSGRGIPLVGVPTLDVLAAPFAFMERHYVCPLIDAKKGEVFCSLYYVSYGKFERLTGYIAVKPEDIDGIVKTPCICLGTGVNLCEDRLLNMGDGITLIKDRFTRVSGEFLIKEGLKRLAADTFGAAEPIYGRKSEAEIKFNITLT